MKNRLTDLNDHLFEQLERLTDEKLSAEAMSAEIQRTAAVVAIADKIVVNARLQLDATKLVIEHGDKVKGKLPMLGSGPALEKVS